MKMRIGSLAMNDQLSQSFPINSTRITSQTERNDRIVISRFRFGPGYNSLILFGMRLAGNVFCV
jgi:hypothetical protein